MINISKRKFHKTGRKSLEFKFPPQEPPAPSTATTTRGGSIWPATSTPTASGRSRDTAALATPPAPPPPSPCPPRGRRPSGETPAPRTTSPSARGAPRLGPAARRTGSVGRYCRRQTAQPQSTPTCSHSR